MNASRPTAARPTPLEASSGTRGDTSPGTSSGSKQDAATTSPTRARRTALWELGVAAPGVGMREGTQLSLPLELPGAPALEPLAAWDAMVADYATTGLTLGAHPLALLRPELPGTVTTADLERLPHKTPVRIGGLVVARQRPGTAKGIVFLLMEDEHGMINVIVPPDVYERHRLIVRTEPLVLARGRLEKLPAAGGALNVLVHDLRALSMPTESAAEVVPLRDAATADGREAGHERAAAAPGATAAPEDALADGAMADFREVAPAVQSFASGRRR